MLRYTDSRWNLKECTHNTPSNRLPRTKVKIDTHVERRHRDCLSTNEGGYISSFFLPVKRFFKTTWYGVDAGDHGESTHVILQTSGAVISEKILLKDNFRRILHLSFKIYNFPAKLEQNCHRFIIFNHCLAYMPTFMQKFHCIAARETVKPLGCFKSGTRRRPFLVSVANS